MIKKQKTWKEFFRGEAIERYWDEVSDRNENNLKSFSVLGMVMVSFAIIFGWIMHDIFTFSTEFLIMWVYFMVMYIVTKFIHIHRKQVTAIFYLWVTPIMIMGNIMGTFGDPMEPSITIMVFLCVIPMFILDKPWRIVMFIIIHAVAYTICCYYAKSVELFVADMIDLVLFSVLSVGVNCLILRDRIDNVEYAMDMLFIAETDSLTRLNNRRSGEEKIRDLLGQGKSGVFMLIDFDDFKRINDNYGHANGDKALYAVATCLRQSFLRSDIVMRFGGDEFAVFTENLKNNEETLKCIEHIKKKLNRLSIKGIPNQTFTVSIGISIVESGSYKSFETIYYESDKALYKTKRNGKNSYNFYEENI